MPATELLPEWKACSRLVLPIVSCGLLLQVTTVANQAVVGRYGAFELAANGLATMLMNAAYFFMVGLSTAVDTQASQAVGAGNVRQARVVVRRGLYVCALFCVPSALLLLFAEPVLARALGVDAALAARAAQYAAWHVPGMVGMTFYSVLQKVLAVHDILAPSVRAAVASNVAYPVLLLATVEVLGLGPVATAMSLSGARVVMFLWVLHRYRSLDASLSGGDEVTTKAVLDPAASVAFCKLAVSGGLLVGLEAWNFDLTTAEAGHIGTTAVAAHQTMLTVCGFTFMALPFALAVVASLRVGNNLGQGNSKAAVLAAKFCTYTTLGYMVLVSVFFLALPGQIADLFTTDPEVHAMIVSVCPVVAAFQLVDGAQAAMGGVLRGTGRQSLLAVIIFVCLWGLGLPTGFGTFRGAASAPLPSTTSSPPPNPPPPRQAHQVLPPGGQDAEGGAVAGENSFVAALNAPPAHPRPPRSSSPCSRCACAASSPA